MLFLEFHFVLYNFNHDSFLSNPCLFKYLFPFSYVGIAYVVLISGIAFLLLDVVLWHLTKNKTESVQCNLWKGSGQNFNAHRRSSSFGWEMVYTVKQVGRSPRQSELPFVVKGKKSSLSFVFVSAYNRRTMKRN